MRKYWPLLMLVLLLLGSNYPNEVWVDERTRTEICFAIRDEMFPKHWHSDRIHAEVEPLALNERQRFISILNRTLSKYPGKVIRDHVSRVYGLKRMNFYGVPFGGTNIGNTIFICDDETNPHYTDNYIEGVFHHEFSSILKRNFPTYLNINSWEAINEPHFVYGIGGVFAIRTGDASLLLDPELFESGFLTRYSQASVEEDINVFAQNMFIGNKDFWEIVDTYPRLRRKAQLMIRFYNRIDSRFSETYFKNHIPYLARQ